MEDSIMTTALRSSQNKVEAATSHQCRSVITTTPTLKVNDYLTARIEWCHRQATEALTTLEALEWYAEQNGLIDALIERDCSHDYQDLSTLRERYTRGLQDGKVLIQVAKTHISAYDLRRC
jgi:hypothetical protein